MKIHFNELNEGWSLVVAPIAPKHRRTRDAEARDAAVLELLATPKSIGELAVLMGIGERTVRLSIVRLSGSPKRIFVAGHMPASRRGRRESLYAKGSNPDVQAAASSSLDHADRQHNAAKADAAVKAATERKNTWYAALGL